MNDLLSRDNVDMIKSLIVGLSGYKSHVPVHKDPLPDSLKRKNPNREESEDEKFKNAIARLYAKYASAEQRPSDHDLRRMYDVVQADANLSKKISGLGFGTTGEAYRKAAIKLRIMALLNVLRDGKNIRNDIVHKPGYIPSEQATERAIGEYAQASNAIADYLKGRGM